VISIEQLKKRLPKDALLSIESIFSPAIFNSILLSFREEKPTTFRVNTLKIDKQSVVCELRKAGFKFSNLEFIDNAFKLSKEESKKLLKTTQAIEGKIYLQSISSLLPPLILNPKEGDRILDMAASPGSKTTQIAALSSNKAFIDAIEPDFVRMERLKHNAELLGAQNINFFQTEGQIFCKNASDFYDKILLDAPCSGEGRFSIYDKNSYGNWKIGNVQKLSNLQKKLLKSAVKSVKKGGIIVYSTCTLNIKENEEVVDSILREEEFKVKILPIENKFKNLKESVEPFLNFEEQKFDKSLKDALRIIPSKDVEGFFICKLVKI